jgi:hypothetical protein
MISRLQSVLPKIGESINENKDSEEWIPKFGTSEKFTDVLLQV